MILNATEAKLIALVKQLPSGIPIHVDETILIAYKRDYNEDPVKKLVKFINICRKFGKPVLLNSPSFWDLDKDIRNLCDFRVTIIKRGIAVVRHKNPNPEYEDLWMRDESKELIDKEIGHDLTDLNAVIRGLEKCKNFLFTIRFDDLDEKEYERYEEMSKREEGKQLDLDEKKVYPMIKAMTWIILTRGYFKKDENTFVNFNAGVLSRLLNEEIGRSHYAQEFSKFRASRPVLLGYKKEWRDEVERVQVSLPFDNNNNITDSVDRKESAPNNQLPSEPEDLEASTEEIA